jgi:RNA polymerase sigma factor (sigma-70 family)
MQSDETLVADVLNGNTQAFSTIITRYKARVYGLALSFLKDFDLASDASQEAFLRAYLNLHQLDDPARLGAWLSSIASNICRMWLRAMKETLPLDHLHEEPSGTETSASPERPDQIMERETARQIVLKALSSLSEANRQAVTLYYIDGLKTSEIASFLGASPAAVRQRLRRSRGLMQKELLDMVENTLQTEAPDDDFDAEFDRLLEEARASFVRSEHQGAVAPLEQAHALAPEHALVSTLLAQAYTRGRTAEEVNRDRTPFHKAGEILRDAVEKNPDNLQLRIQLAEHNSVSGIFEDIVREHEDLLERASGKPIEPWVLLRMARVYAPRRRHEQALEYYRRLIELEPKLAGIACLEMGISHYLQEDWEGGIDCLHRSMSALDSLQPNELQHLTRKVFGEAYSRFAERFDETLSWRICAHTWLAGLYGKLARHDDARTHLSKASELLTEAPSEPVRRRLTQDLVFRVRNQFKELADEEVIRKLAEETDQS